MRTTAVQLLLSQGLDKLKITSVIINDQICHDMEAHRVLGLGQVKNIYPVYRLYDRMSLDMENTQVLELHGRALQARKTDP